MIALAASAFPWPGQEIPRKAHLPKARTQVLLLRANDLGSRAENLEISIDLWPHHIRLSDLESMFVCQACGQRGADIRPDFDWDKEPKAHRAIGGL
jgi:hypothetical protein